MGRRNYSGKNKALSAFLDVLSKDELKFAPVADTFDRIGITTMEVRPKTNTNGPSQAENGRANK